MTGASPTVSPAFADTPGLERPWRLPHTLWCYRPYAVAPDVGPSPIATEGHVTFTCLNNPGKVSRAALAAWSEILRALPDARLMLLTSPDAGRVEALRQFFDERGVASARIEFVSRVPLLEDLALYHMADIGLDTFPYTGGATTCDAAWMGVPVVTLAGNRPFARSGASILTNLRLADLVTECADSYIANFHSTTGGGPRRTPPTATAG